jgi:cyclopropane fatty-acyl-phospholipid synthase-like methyltransferase
MGTKDFNPLDAFIARWRLRQVRQQVLTGGRLLDFGCGHQAFLLRSVSQQISHGIGLDYDAEPEKIGPNIEILRARFSGRLEFPDHSFDQVSILAVLEHIPVEGVDILFREFRRVLAPGGQVLVTTPTPAAKPVLEFLAFKLKIISEPEIADHKHYYTRKDILDVANRNDFEMKYYTNFQFGFNCLAVFGKTA